MKKLLTALAFACAFFMLATPAEAKRQDRYRRAVTPVEQCFGFCDVSVQPKTVRPSGDWRDQSKRHMSGLGPRPRAWCGWWMRGHTGLHDARLNLARNWAHVGSNAGGPAPGVIGVWRGHVVKVLQVLPGNKILAISGNDSRAVRTRVRSARGAIAWRRV